jgi:hypothetical protein
MRRWAVAVQQATQRRQAVVGRQAAQYRLRCRVAAPMWRRAAVEQQAVPQRRFQSGLAAQLRRLALAGRRAAQRCWRCRAVAPTPRPAVMGQQAAQHHFHSQAVVPKPPAAVRLLWSICHRCRSRPAARRQQPVDRACSEAPSRAALPAVLPAWALPAWRRPAPEPLRRRRSRRPCRPDEPGLRAAAALHRYCRWTGEAFPSPPLIHFAC